MATIVTEFINQEVILLATQLSLSFNSSWISAVSEGRSRRYLAVGEHCMGVVSAHCSLWVWFTWQVTWFVTKCSLAYRQRLRSVALSFSNLQRSLRAAHSFKSFTVDQCKHEHESTTGHKKALLLELAGLGAPFLRCCKDAYAVPNE